MMALLSHLCEDTAGDMRPVSLDESHTREFGRRCLEIRVESAWGAVPMLPSLRFAAAR